jgi:hypothetical protein
MIIRATKKLLNTSGIKPTKNLNDPNKKMPGEWYASTISLSRPGKLAVHFLHYPTFITILIPGKSLNKVIPFLSDRVSSLLKRSGYFDLQSQFLLDSNPEIFATNSKSILAHINQLKINIEYHLADALSIESIDYNKIEDIHLDYIFTDKSNPKGFFTPIYNLDSLLKKSKKFRQLTRSIK